MVQNKPSILITGVAGFAGRWAASLFSRSGMSVIGIMKDELPVTDPLHKYLSTYIVVDMGRPFKASLLKELHCDYILHLACVTLQQAKMHGIGENDLLRINLNIDANLISIIKTLKPKRSVVVSSCAVYKKTLIPSDEMSEIDATNVYEESKLILEAESTNLMNEGYDLLIARPFNHIGPHQTDGFFVPDMVKKIRATDGPILEVGNIHAKRDFVDTRDIARAYKLLLRTPVLKSRVFNIGTGRVTTGGEILGRLITFLGSNIQPLSTVDSSTVNDVIVSNSSRIRLETGWRPRYSLNKSIQDYVKSQEKLVAQRL